MQELEGPHTTYSTTTPASMLSPHTVTYLGSCRELILLSNLG